MQNININDNLEIALSVTTTTPAQIKAELQALFDNQRDHKEILLSTIRWTLANGNSKGMNTNEVYRLFTRVATNETASQPMIDNFIKVHTTIMASNNLQFM